MKKITLLGAGSGFTQPLFTDILNIKGLDRGIIGLVDIDEKRLSVNVKLMHRLLKKMGKTKWKIEASTDRKKILPKTNYLINTIEVSGTACVKKDYEIPLKYGINQCIGDTVGPGGVMKALRTLPAWLDIIKDAEKLCPDALLMNYTNPMSIMSLATLRSTGMPYIGLCHSVQGTAELITELVGIPFDELDYECGGVNHIAWYTKLQWKNRDLYPAILEAMKDPEKFKRDPVRLEMVKQFGYYVTESSGHFSEYVPYFRKRKDLINKHCGKEYHGASGFYSKNWPSWRKKTDKERRAMAAGKKEIPTKRSYEYAADIIEAHALNIPKTVYASVLNKGLITNLPQKGVVEVKTLIDRNGYSPTYFGELPEHTASICRANMAVYELCAQGILDRDREAVIHAMMVDPLSAAVCSPGEIREMAEKLLAAEKRYIPKWASKKPVKTGKRIKLPLQKGPAGLKGSAMAKRNENN
ncbi:MAG: alpha-glucosidase/alpha-galactosidase [Fibrobacterota bacterium]